jgi:hypothetical protein
MMKRKPRDEESGGNDGAVESRKAKSRLPTLPTSAMEIPPKAGGFPHSHRSGGEADGKVQNQKPVLHFPTAAYALSGRRNENKAAAGFALRRKKLEM